VHDPPDALGHTSTQLDRDPTSVRGRARHERIHTARVEQPQRIVDQLIDAKFAGRRIGVAMTAPIKVQDPVLRAAELGYFCPARSARAPAREKQERRIAASLVVISQAEVPCL
jgi:hypothetical protein